MLKSSRPTGVRGVVHGAAQVQADSAAGEVVDDVARVGQRASEAVELGHDKCVAGAAGGERLRSRAGQGRSR
jgi:hypothetical protein